MHYHSYSKKFLKRCHNNCHGKPNEPKLHLHHMNSEKPIVHLIWHACSILHFFCFITPICNTFICFFFSHTPIMATPKKMMAPPHCQLRSAVTGLKCLKDNMMRSLAAIQTYASEGRLPRAGSGGKQTCETIARRSIRGIDTKA